MIKRVLYYYTPNVSISNLLQQFILFLTVMKLFLVTKGGRMPRLWLFIERGITADKSWPVVSDQASPLTLLCSPAGLLTQLQFYSNQTTINNSTTLFRCKKQFYK